MKRSPNPSHPYQIVLTTFGLVSILSCASPQRSPAIPIVTVPNESDGGAGSSPAPVDQKPSSRSSTRMWTWETQRADAVARARREHLPLVVYVRADWSAGSLEMDRDVWSDPRILFQSHAVVALRIDVTDGPDAELWAEEYRVGSVPSTIFIDADGNEVTRLEGPRSVEEVLSAMRGLEDR